MSHKYADYKDTKTAEDDIGIVEARNETWLCEYCTLLLIYKMNISFVYLIAFPCD